MHDFLHSHFTGALKLSLIEVVLNATNHTVCFTVAFTTDNIKESNDPRSFTITLLWARNQDYNVNFHQQNITIDTSCKLSLSLSLNDDNTAQGCPVANNVVYVAIPIVIIIIITILAIIIGGIYVWERHRTQKSIYFNENVNASPVLSSTAH